MIVEGMPCPCKGCENRHESCHGKCEAYDNFKKEREVYNNKKTQESLDLSAYIRRVTYQKRRRNLK